MALTLVSMPCSGSGPWVALRVGGPKPGGLYPSVDLGRGDRGVAEQLLDGPEVGAAVEQVGREGVAQGVRGDAAVDRGVARPHPQAAPDVGGREPAAGLREEERVLPGLGRQRRARALEVAP